MDEFSQLDPVYAAWFYFRMGEYDSGPGFTDALVNHVHIRPMLTSVCGSQIQVPVRRQKC